MKKWQKILLIVLFVFTFIASLIRNMPAWLLGGLISHYSQGRVSTSYEHGTFWNGHAMFYSRDANGKSSVPLQVLGWTIKLGFSKFVDISFTAANQPIAHASLTKQGLVAENIDLRLSLDQLAPLLGNLSSFGLSGNVHVSSSRIILGKGLSGTVNINLEDVGSGISPVNPVGSFQITADLASTSINVSSSPDSVLIVNGSGNFNNLILNSKVQNDKKEQMLQFMTMMGIPQADGSYQLKVF